jgi:phage gp46-like protein
MQAVGLQLSVFIFLGLGIVLSLWSSLGTSFLLSLATNRFFLQHGSCFSQNQRWGKKGRTGWWGEDRVEREVTSKIETTISL